jgi:hypothetical protein
MKLNIKNRSGVRAGIGDKIIPCPLVGEILFHDCHRVNQTIEERNKLRLAKVLDPEDMESESLVCGLLPEYLREYAVKMPQVSGKGWDKIAPICTGCLGTANNPTERNYNPEKITMVRKDGLKVRNG